MIKVKSKHLLDVSFIKKHSLEVSLYVTVLNKNCMLYEKIEHKNCIIWKI